MRETPKVITFYSYKGGTGRTMALANVAWILASAGKTVLAVDWDLEAPGLHRYFGPFLEDEHLERTDGLIDLLVQYMVAATKPPPDSEAPDPNWYEPYADLVRYAEPLQWRFPDGGRIDLLGAGRQDSTYGERVNRFDWAAFYERFGGSAFLDTAFGQAREEYDFILIDSRTGVSDTSGICTVHLPDALAVFFTLNDQSIDGASTVAKAVRERRAAMDDGPGFPIFPVATRIELAEKDKLETRRQLARRRFEPLLHPGLASQADDYFGHAEVLYDPYYAYEETLATVEDEPGRKNSVLAAMETLTGHLTGGEVAELKSVSESKRLEAREAFTTTLLQRTSSAEDTPRPERWDVFLTSNDPEHAALRDLRNILAARVKVFEPTRSIPSGEHIERFIEGARESAPVHVYLLTGDSPQLRDHVTLKALEDSRSQGHRTVPILVGSDREAWQTRFLLLRDLNVPLVRNKQELEAVGKEILQSLGVRPSTDPRNSAPSAPAPSVPGPHRTRPSLVRALLPVLGVLLIVAFGISQWIERRQNAAALETQRLIRASVEQVNIDPTLSLLLAREAALTAGPEDQEDADRRLRQALVNSREIGRLSFTTVVRDMVFDADATSLLVISEGGYATAWNPADSTAFEELSRAVSGTAVTDGSGRFLVARDDGSVTRIPTGRGAERLVAFAVQDVEWGPLGRALVKPVGTHQDPRYHVVQLGGRHLRTVDGVSAPREPWSSLGALLVFDEGLPNVRILSSDLETVRRLVWKDEVLAAAWTPDGGRLVTMDTRYCNLWVGAWGREGEGPSSSSSPLASWKHDLLPPYRISIGPRGLIAVTSLRPPRRFQLFTTTDDETRQNAQETFPRSGTEGEEFTTAVHWDPTRPRLAAGTASRRIRIWQPASPNDALWLIGHEAPVTLLAWSRNGSRLASASSDGTVRVWDVSPAGPDVLGLNGAELVRLASERSSRSFSPIEIEEYLGGRVPATGGPGGQETSF